MTDFIYLASQSPRRSQLLDQIGVRHELLLAGPGEDAEALEAEQAGEAPRDYVERVTRAKIHAACQRRVDRGLPEAPVLCADTTVTIDGRILGKPADEADARRMLSLLSGRQHAVISAVALASRGRADEAAEPWVAVSTSLVQVAPLSERQIDAYIASGEPFGKAGAYGIQGKAAAWIVRIEGSYSGIMGLPLHETAELLARAGLAV